MCQIQVRHRLAPRGQVDFRNIERVTRLFSFPDFDILGHSIPPCRPTSVFSNASCTSQEIRIMTTVRGRVVGLVIQL
jgi:hypothetical protein